MKIDKKELLQKIITQLESELVLIAEAAKNTYDIATHEENKPENEYDTRGLEASYLAGAQAERVSEMKNTIVLLKALKIKDFSDSDAIAFSAIVETESDGKTQWMFVLPSGGGIKINFSEHLIQTVTPHSPLGEALIGLHVGDVAAIDAGKKQKEYEIVSIL